MLRVTHCIEWLWYGFWYRCAWLILDLPKWITHDAVWLRPWALWIVQQGWVFPYLPTLAERQEMQANAKDQADAA